MKKINKFFAFACIATATAAVVSCADYLDVSDELADTLTIEEVFENASYTKRWHGNIFNCIIEYSENASTANNMSNPWSAISGEMVCNFARNTLVTGYTPANTPYDRWDPQYDYIRQALIFLERAHPIGVRGQANYIGEGEINRMKSEAKFLVAYMYFTLLELYGPVPVVTELADPGDRGIDYARAPMDEVINLIDTLLAEVISESEDANNEMPASIKDGANYLLDQMVRPTKITALALRAKLWVYAASKLFNGGYPESLTVANRDGTLLFPAADPGKWQTAKLRMEEFLDFAHSVGHELHREYYPAGHPSAGEFNPHESVYQIFQKYTNEIIWATPYNDYSNQNAQERRSNPVNLYASPTNFANIGISQESVDAFFMDNGMTIWDSGSGYREDGFTTVNNPTHVNNNPDPNVFNMYASREPRFYATVGYNGKSWHIHQLEHNNPAGVFYQWFARGKGSGVNAGGNDNSPRAGYLLYKFKNRRVAQGTTSINVAGAPGTPFAVHTSWSRPSILFRLADFYLYYAEVLNEINPGDPLIIEYIDRVRSRAGIPGYAEMQNSGVKTGVIGNKEAQFKAIVQERHVEFVGEGQRWFDMRRWMIADNTDANNPDKGGVDGNMTRISGMNRDGFDNVAPGYAANQTVQITPLGDPASFYRRTRLENRQWFTQYYWYPIPIEEINKSRGRLLVQNPGWPEVVIVDPAAE